jgi:hypothetical protein
LALVLKLPYLHTFTGPKKNDLFELTDMAAIKFDSHGDVPIPGVWNYSNELSSDWWIHMVYNNSVHVLVTSEILNKKNKNIGAHL